MIPAAVLGVLGVIFALQATALLIPMDYAVSTIPILAGIALLVYAYHSHRHGQDKAPGN